MNFSGQTLEELELEEDDMNGPFFLLCVHHLVKFLLVSIEAYRANVSNQGATGDLDLGA